MTPTEKLQAEAEQLYPYDASIETGTSEWGIDQEITDMQRAAHVACAEKYTAIIEGLKQKHEERILILALDMQKKDQEIERLRGVLKSVVERKRDLVFPFFIYQENDVARKMGNALNDIDKIATNALNNQTPTP